MKFLVAALATSAVSAISIESAEGSLDLAASAITASALLNNAAAVEGELTRPDLEAAFACGKACYLKHEDAGARAIGMCVVNSCLHHLTK